MPVYHVVLYKLKHDASSEDVQKWLKLSQTMVGIVPGLLSLRSGPPVRLTASMAKGFNMGAVLLLDYVESLATLLTHPIHEEVHKLYEKVCDTDSTMAYDLEM